jgi:cytochrome P450
MCIGNHFALMEARIILAAMVQRFAISAVPGNRVRLNPQIVLTTHGPFPARIDARKPRPSAQSSSEAHAAPAG